MLSRKRRARFYGDLHLEAEFCLAKLLAPIRVLNFLDFVCILSIWVLTLTRDQIASRTFEASPHLPVPKGLFEVMHDDGEVFDTTRVMCGSEYLADKVMKTAAEHEFVLLSFELNFILSFLLSPN